MLASIVSYTLVYYCGGEESGESGGGGGRVIVSAEPVQVHKTL